MRRLRWISVGLLVVIILTLLTGELFLRLRYGLGRPLLYVAHPTIGYVAKPNQNLTRFGNHIKTNDFGMRSPVFSPTKNNPDELRVLLLGDSIIFGGHPTDQKDLPGSILQNQLEKKLDRPILVATAACGGWGPANMLAYIREHGLFDADVVVLVLSTHDWGQYRLAKLPAQSANTQHPNRNPLTAIGETITRYLPALWANWRNSGGQIAVFSKDQKANPKDLQTTWNPSETSESVVRELVEFVAQHHIPMIVGLHQDENELKSNPYPAYEQWQSLFKVLHIPVYEFAPKFDLWLQKDMSPYRDSIHPNKLGHDAIATTLLQPVLDVVSP